MSVIFRAMLLAFAAVRAFAQPAGEDMPADVGDDAAAPMPRYTVELIIFAYGEGVPTGNEIWLPDEPDVKEAPLPVDAYVDDRSFPAAEEPLSEIELPAVERRYMDVGLALLDPADYTTDEIYDELVELDAYEPLMRAGWTQHTFESALTRPIELEALDDPPAGLDGRVALYRGRFLHLVVDLSLDADFRRMLPGETRAEGVPTFADARVRADDRRFDEFGERLPPPIRYRISEDRIMRSGDIRYFDHPKFGAIAKLTRVEDGEEQEIVDDSDILLPGN